METGGEASNQLLKEKYHLHKSPEVEEAANRTKARTGEKIPQDPLIRVQNYLDRFHEITDRKDLKKREHGIDAIKRLLYSKYVIKPEDIPKAYFDNQRRLAREQGHGNIEITEEMRNQLTEVIIADQQSSLDKWIDYLSSPDAPYSDALKYFTLRSVLNMGEYDKAKQAYPQRSQGTTKPFPDLNREALSYVLDAIDKKYKGQNIDLSALEEKDRQQFERLLQGDNFSKLYAWAIEKVTPASEAELSATAGTWIKYDKGSDHMPLVQSLQGHGTGWCTAGESTAQAQLQAGDFYVYYSHDKDGKPTVPRAAIRIADGKIAEVRGIAKEQNLDGEIAPVVGEKLKEFPDGELYQKKSQDMKLLTEIENKIKKGQSLSHTDLTFLYEIDSPIEGFGYEKDPRIQELYKQRNPKEDILVVFSCNLEQIAHSIEELRVNTKVYVGPLEAGIFDKLAEFHIEHVYTSFPEGKVKKQSVQIGGKTREQLQKELKQTDVVITECAEDMMYSHNFTVNSNVQKVDTIRLKIDDLGFSDKEPILNELYQRAQELGLELCSAEIGPQYRLQYQNQNSSEWFYIGMMPLPDMEGDPCIFGVGTIDEMLYLDHSLAKPDYPWPLNREMIFTLPNRKVR